MGQCGGVPRLRARPGPELGVNGQTTLPFIFLIPLIPGQRIMKSVLRVEKGRSPVHKEGDTEGQRARAGPGFGLPESPQGLTLIKTAGKTLYEPRFLIPLFGTQAAAPEGTTPTATGGVARAQGSASPLHQSGMASPARALGDAAARGYYRGLEPLACCCAPKQVLGPRRGSGTHVAHATAHGRKRSRA
ncbi:unnamed protein product [Arctogadus glacialis]